jgi:parallel beta-helix repeat protein
MKKCLFGLPMLFLLINVTFGQVVIAQEPSSDLAINDPVANPFYQPPTEPQEEPGKIQDTATHFEIKNSDYLNITLDSSREVNLLLQSVPEMITLDFQAIEELSESQISISGLKPNTQYYKYQDGYENYVPFITDGEGQYSYIQDLTSAHHIFIQNKPSTKTIQDNATGGNCTLIGTWNAANKTCTLTTNVNESVYIISNGITLNGNGYYIAGGTSGYGVYINGRSNVTVKNTTVKNSSTGIYVSGTATGVTITNNIVRDNNVYGIYLYYNVTSSTISNNQILNNRYYGLEVSSNCSSNTISGNTIEGNGNAGSYVYAGLHFNNTAYNTVTNNTIRNNWDSGIKMETSSNFMINGNAIGNNRNIGILLTASTNGDISSNTIEENDNSDMAVSGAFDSYCNHTVTNNTGSGGKPIGFYKTSSNINGGNYSQLILCNADNSTVDNVTVDGSPTKKNNGLYLYKTDYSTISNVNSLGNKYGIYLYFSNNNTITNNSGLTSNTAAVYLDSANNNNISNGTVSNNEDGISLSKANNNTLENNNVHHNNLNGILLNNSTGNTVKNNNIHDNAISSTISDDNYGLALLFDQTFPNLGNNKLTGNIMLNNNGYNFALFSWSTTALRNNIDTTNTVDGKPIYYVTDANGLTIDESTNAGTVYCISCTNTTVKNLNLKNNFAGVYLHRGVNCQVENVILENNNVNIYGQYSTQNSIIGNTTSGGYYGILFSPYGGCASGTCKDNVVKGNTGSNSYYGFYFNADTTRASNNVFMNNTFGAVVYGPNSIVRNNTFLKNQTGIRSSSFANNNIYNNNFLNNTTQMVLASTRPNLNLPLPDGGNFWSDWTTPDGNYDGFVDNPYVVVAAPTPPVQDNYPWTIENGWLPKTTISFAGTAGNDNWFKSDVTVTLTATDNNTIAKTEYSFDKISWNVYSGPFIISDEGEKTIYFHSIDSNGDSEKINEDHIKIDKTPPVVTAVKTPEPNGNGWNNSEVTINFTCNDNLSGIFSCSPPTILSTEGVNQSVSATATDKAGNTTTADISGVNIDKTGPVITISTPVEEKTYILNENLIADWSVTDALSGIDTASGTKPDGEVIDTSAVGPKTFTVTAKDKAGNEANKTINYRIAYDFSGLLEPIKEGKEYKAGSTIPLKFQLKDAKGNLITNAVVKVYLVDKDGTEIPGTPAGNSSPDNSFRYADDKYMFNLKTNDLTPGAWQIKIVLDDGTLRLTPIVLK